MTRIRRDPEAGRTLAELIFGVILISLAIALVGTICLPGRWYFLGGVAVGAVTAVLLVINMYDTIDAAVMMPEKRARSYASMHAVLRILVTAVLLGIAVWISPYAFAGLALGVASLKVSGLLHGPLSKLFEHFVPKPAGKGQPAKEPAGKEPAGKEPAEAEGEKNREPVQDPEKSPNEGIRITGMKLTAQQMDAQVDRYISGTGPKRRGFGRKNRKKED